MDGKFEGDKVGKLDGWLEGITEGINDTLGTPDGCAVGSDEGVLDGCVVGKTDGVELGMPVGLREGLPVGSIVVGCNDGLADGSKVSISAVTKSVIFPVSEFSTPSKGAGLISQPSQSSSSSSVT